MIHTPAIEPLETRIAPASVTYIDIDGDVVKVTASAGPLDAGDFVFRDNDPDGQLATLNLTDPLFAGANITFAVTKKPGGDGFAHVGYINATGVDLGAVNVKGDLGRIDAGNGDPAQPAAKSLTAQSLGRFRLSTQEVGTGDLVSTFAGRLGALVVKGDIVEARVETTGGAGGSIGAITVGGSIIGGDGVRGGTIESSGDMGPVKIGRDLLGGRDHESGKLLSQGKLASLTIGGSIIGGAGSYWLVDNDRGQVHSDGDAGPIKIGRDVRGGASPYGGTLTFGGSLASLTIGGSLMGTAADHTGEIELAKGAGPLKIGGNVEGGRGLYSGRIENFGVELLTSVTLGGSLIGGSFNDFTGEISSNGPIGAVKIAGDVVGTDAVAGRAGRIDGQQDIGSVTIGGSLIGGLNGSAGTIYTEGDMGPVKIGRDVLGGGGENCGFIGAAGKLGSVTIGGSVVGGSGTESGAIRAGEAMGAVKIGGDLVGGTTTNAGSIFDPAGGAAGTLASVTIGGSVRGGTAFQTGAIVFEGAIGAVKIGRNLEGGSIYDGALDQSGYIEGARIASIFIGGSVLAGFDLSSGGQLTHNASIRADHDIGAITIKGSLVGVEAIGGLTRTIISARGQEALAPGAKSDLAIKSVSIGGHVSLAQVLAGFDPDDADDAGSNGNASIGAVKIGGDWYASSISAGVNRGSLGFGHSGDVISNPPGAAADAIVARIASITIKGAVIGAPNPFFQTGFTAQQIGAFKAAGFTAPLTAATDAQILLTPFTLNVNILEV